MKVFVYGTLKRGQRAAKYLSGQRFLGEAFTARKYRLYDCGGYPGMTEADGGGSVQGEVWEISELCRTELDAYEGVEEGWYELRRVDLDPPWAAAEVFSYVYLRDLGGLPGRAEGVWE
jgi:gamma-glutamylaminecyclotransferase